jgi:hypothetical protein
MGRVLSVEHFQERRARSVSVWHPPGFRFPVQKREKLMIDETDHNGELNDGDGPLTLLGNRARD